MKKQHLLGTALAICILLIPVWHKLISDFMEFDSSYKAGLGVSFVFCAFVFLLVWVKCNFDDN